MAYPGTWARRAWFIPMGLAAIVRHQHHPLRGRCSIVSDRWPQIFGEVHALHALFVFYLVIFGLWVLWANVGGSAPASPPAVRLGRPAVVLAAGPRRCLSSAMARQVGRHPRLWGALFAVLLLVAYVGAVRPARVWTAAHVARAALRVGRHAAGARPSRSSSRPSDPDAVFAVPRDRADGRDPRQLARERRRRAEWSAPVGVLFLLPALFLVFVFPTRPFWLVLLAYHLVVGAVSLAVFAVGLGWFEPAFRLYLFTRTYLTESVSLVVPLLLYLAARGARPARRRRAPLPTRRARQRPRRRVSRPRPARPPRPARRRASGLRGARRRRP